MISLKILGLPLLDIVVILAYFAVVLWIGYRAMQRIGNSEDYFLAGRKFGKAIQTFAAFGQGDQRRIGGQHHDDGQHQWRGWHWHGFGQRHDGHAHFLDDHYVVPADAVSESRRVF
jgi:hypothetical protein